MMVVVLAQASANSNVASRFGGSLKFTPTPAFTRMAAAAFLGSCLPLAPIQPAFAGIDALDAANKAMPVQADPGDEPERKFDALPEASKKRRAIAACKDKDLRATAGYRSAAR